MMYYNPATINWFSWPKRATPDPPAPKIDYGALIAELRRDHDRMAAITSTLRDELGAARRDLATQIGYSEMLKNITGRQDSMLVEMSTALSATQEQLRSTVVDKQFQAQQIKSLQLDLEALRVKLAEAENLRAITYNQNLGLQSALRQSEAENAAMRAEIITLKGAT